MVKKLAHLCKNKCARFFYVENLLYICTIIKGLITTFKTINYGTSRYFK